MAVELYFGLPGCGKTTMLAAKAEKAIITGSYKNVYSNVKLAIPGVIYIDNDCIGKYDLSDCLLLIDEATLFADSRAYKSFDIGKLTYFLEHRHYNADIILFTQQWDGVDRKIRVITDRVYYVYKGLFLGKWFSTYYRIPYGIIIPDPKKNDSQKLGEIVQGYCKPNILIRLFAPRLFRPRYYKYFDSWERPPMPALPQKYRPYFTIKDGQIIDTLYKPSLFTKTAILLRLRQTKKVVGSLAANCPACPHPFHGCGNKIMVLFRLGYCCPLSLRVGCCFQRLNVLGARCVAPPGFSKKLSRYFFFTISRFVYKM